MGQITLSRFPKMGRRRELIEIDPSVLAEWKAKRTREDLNNMSEEFDLPKYKFNNAFSDGYARQEVIDAMTLYYANRKKVI